MTKLTIEICAKDDWAAVRVLARFKERMDTAMSLNDNGYVDGHFDGNGTVKVDRIKDGDK